MEITISDIISVLTPALRGGGNDLQEEDVKKIVENLVYAFFFATPIIWSENMVSAKIQKILIFNPFYHFIVLFRNPLMNNIDEKFYQSFFICLLLMIGIFFIKYLNLLLFVL